METIRLDKQAIADITDKLLTARKSNLKQLLDIGHRLETVAQIDGVDYVDDSKATHVDATMYSLTCMETPTVWCLASPELPISAARLRPLVEEKVKAILFIGPGNDDSIVEEFVDVAGVVHACDDMEELLAQAKSLSDEGDTVLFSPALSSLPLWEDYRERGRAFQAAVKQLGE